MKALVFLVLTAGAPAMAGYTLCAQAPFESPCPIVWHCPCPGPDGVAAPCDYAPGHVLLCGRDLIPGDWGPGNFVCDGTDETALVQYDCQPLGQPCESEKLCEVAKWEIPRSGWHLNPATGSATWPTARKSASCTADAQPNPRCEREQYCNPSVACCPSFGDPIAAKDDNSVEHLEDLRVPTSLGPLTFERYFTKSPYAYAWQQVPGAAKPFGTSPLNESTMHWTHNWHSMVRRLAPDEGQKYALLDTTGMISQFHACSPMPCYASAVGGSATEDMLYVESNRITLLRPSTGRFIYESALGADSYYLTRWEDPQYAAAGESPRVRAALTYATPPGCPVYAASGVPYLSGVQAADGTRLVFSWTANTCSLRSVAVGKGAAVQVAVQFSLSQYSGDGGSLNLTAAFGSDAGAGTEVYAFSPSVGWSRTRDGVQVARHPYNTGTLADFGQGDVELFRKSTVQSRPCTVGGCDAGSAYAYNWTEYVPQFGQTYRTARTRTVTLERVPLSTQPMMTSSSEGCDFLECTGSVTRSLAYESTATGPRVKSASNGRGGYTVNGFGAGAVLPTGGQRVELVSRLEGATTAAGASPLLAAQYTYAYGSVGQTPRGYEQYVAEERRPSVLYAGQQARLVTRRDSATNRVTAEFKTGWTRDFNATTATWSDIAKVVGTFYFTQRKCTDNAADSLGRTLEVHGPCFVSDIGATDCPMGTVFPVTQYGYYPTNAANPLNASRREYVRTWVSVNDPSRCTGVQLTTAYGNYDLRGGPGLVTDANGMATTLTYEDGRLKTSTLNGQTTSYTWDNGKLAAVRHPEGNYDVYCYRQAALGTPCSRSLPATRQLQWEAKAPAADGSRYTEGIAYFYLPDGRRTRQEVWDGLRNEKRRQLAFSENARGQVTRTMQGTAQAGLNLLKRYDADGNVTGINAATINSQCGEQAVVGGSGSPTCANLRLDGLGRIQSLDVVGATLGVTGRTCIAYDAQGNVSSVKLGCPSDSGSYPGPDCAACTQPASSYMADDFGNVVSMKLPHLGSNASGGEVRQSFNALGLPVLRQTPAMQANSGFHAFTYDGLGRLLVATNQRLGASSAAETLYSLVYDNAATLSSTCPQPVGTMGRLLRRVDTFGQTWFQYSPEGRLLGEVRVRLGGSCTGALPRNVPHTFYAYTPNGNLRGIQYPYGRTVTYSHGMSGGVTTDRVSAIGVTKWNGAAWVAWPAVQSILHEPYGDVRAWQLNADTGGLGVENMLSETAPTRGSGYCPMTKPANNDLSGRLQLVQVSTGPLVVGAGSGNVFQRYLDYSARRVTTEGSCWPSVAARTVELNTPGYAPGEQAVVYAGTYDTRGNRTSMRPFPGYPYSDTYAYSDAGVADRLTEFKRVGGSSVFFQYDVDGRTTSIRLPNDSSGMPAAQEVWTPASTAAQGAGALDSVYKSVSVSGAVYSYYYDAANRRRLKQYPTGVSDEYFYSQSSQLLVDRGNSAVSSPAYLTTDEYVWLGNRPVLVLRGRLDTAADVRSADSTAACSRNGETQACGAYFIITDALPKPIALLDANGKHARKLKWDIFGSLNRTQLRGAVTPHPYAANQSSLLAQMQPVASSMAVSYRYQFDGLDTEGTAAAPVDGVDIQQQYVTLKTVGGYHRGQVMSPWVTQDGGYIMVNFRSGPRNCPPTGCLADGGLPDGGNWPYSGVELVAYELAEREVGAKAFDINLRFPGQYFDAETTKHENWNRYYDPSTGRYLSPEPMFQSPEYVKSMAKQGMSVPAYAYAANNPMRYSDPTGLATYICKQPLERFGRMGGNGRKSGPDIFINPLFHQYLCVVRPGGKTECGGQQPSGGYWSPGKPTSDVFDPKKCDLVHPDNWCMDYCVLNGFDERRPDYGLVPGKPGTENCLEWSNNLRDRCFAACKDVLKQGALPWDE
jgi:RHS repeat-associated protein